MTTPHPCPRRFPVTFLLLGLAVPLAAGAAPPPLGPDDLLPAYRDAGARQAVQHAAAGDWAAARDDLLALSAGGPLPESPERLRFLLGEACLRSGDLLGAASVLEGLESAAPLVADRVLWMRGRALAGLGRAGEAADVLARVPAGSPVAAASRDARLDALVAAGRTAEAAALLRDAPEGDAESASRLAALLAAGGDRAGAEAALRRAWDRASGSGRRALRAALGALGAEAPGSADADELDRARDLLDAHRSEEAVREAGALLTSPDAQVRCDARLVRAAAYGKLRRHAEALADWREALSGCADRTDRARVLFNAARSAYRAGETAEGDRLADRLAADFPDASYNDDLSVSRARQAVARGDTRAATVLLRDSLARWPGGDMAAESRWLLAWAAWTSGDLPAVLERCRAGRAAASDDADFASRFAYWEARALERLKRRKEADAAYVASARQYPLTYYGVLALSRLAGLRKSSPDALAAALADPAARPGPFLTPSDPRAAADGPLARVLWLARTGLPDLARDEALDASAASPDAGWIAALLLDAEGLYTRSHRLAADLLKKRPFWPDDRTAGYWRLAYPRAFRTEVEAAARESAIDPALAWAVMRQESAFVAGVESRANAIGLMQLILPTARSMAKALGLQATPETLRQPAVNVRLGSAYLARLLKELKDPLLAIPGYNAGGGALARKRKEMPRAALDELVESIGANETRDYARKVYENWATYRWLYRTGKDRLPRVKF